MDNLSDFLMLYQRLSQDLTKSFKQFNALQQISRQSLSAVSDAIQSTALSTVVTEIAELNLNAFRSLNLDFINNFPTNEILSAFNMQWDSVAKTSLSYLTPAISELRNHLVHYDLHSGIQSFLLEVSKSIVEAPNIAFLKEAHLLTSSISTELPRGLKSILSEMHTNTAKRLSYSDDISLNVRDKCFFEENEPSNSATLRETNIICSAANLLHGITETELISFMNYIAKIPGFAINHPVGKKINELIQKWKDVSDFDCDIYYHARGLEKAECPYTEAQLAQAPSGVTWHGRYNHVGTSHYYFSDKPKGAVIEVRKHSPKDIRIQIAIIKPKQKIRLLDLSDNKTPSKFLEFCRFSPRHDDDQKSKREYLIPCFVADCCKNLNNIDGIRYYGSKEYSNYVAWSDHYFQCIGFDFDEPQ